MFYIAFLLNINTLTYSSLQHNVIVFTAVQLHIITGHLGETILLLTCKCNNWFILIVCQSGYGCMQEVADH